MRTAHRKASRAKRDIHAEPSGASAFQTIDAVFRGIAVLSKQRREEEMAPIRAARHLLQFGGFTNQSWAELADAFNISEAIMQPGIRIARDHYDTVATAQRALVDLRQRRIERGSWTATSQQLKDIDEALWLYEKAQLANVSTKELEMAKQIVRNVIAGARSGSPGATTVHVDDIDDSKGASAGDEALRDVTQ